ncbi:MAG: alkaline phosphatase family protein [Candidatus Acidiferrales bacterium]
MIHKNLGWLAAGLMAMSMAAALPSGTMAQSEAQETATPIKHVVVIFDENISFDHYFGTYPHATNPKGETAFHAKSDTPRVNNLLAAGLLDQNPNSTQPFRVDPAHVVTCDQGHGYTEEQSAFNHGLLDKFPENTGSGGPGCYDYGKSTGVVMGYFDGNTVTAIWNYAQHYAMSDNSYSTMFGPSTVGALNLIAGKTTTATMSPFDADGVTPGNPNGDIAGGQTTGAAIGDPRPLYDICNATTPLLGVQHTTLISITTGKNVGDLLNSKGITWGWFQGGFRPTSYIANPKGGTPLPVCAAESTNLAGPYNDYIPHHEPFQYFESTANPYHIKPSNAGLIGTSKDGANHQYDLQDFWAALGEGRLPAVTFLKAKGIQDGHPGYSDPTDEQVWLVTVINAIENSPEWKDTAIVIAYDDSDGWYDHAMGTIINQSNVSDDSLTAPGACGLTASENLPGRCGYGPRQPLIVISPYAKQNYVDHRLTDQSSILRFIEDNWDLGRIGDGSADETAGKLDGLFDFDSAQHAPRLVLDPSTGVILKQNQD